MVSVELLPPLALGIAALYVLVKSAKVAVDRLTGVAQYYDVPDALIAMSVIAVGTSLPEIGSHVIASLGILSGTLDYSVASGTVLGGNMGSSTAQQLLLFGMFVVGYGGLELRRGFVRSSYLPMLFGFVLTLVLGLDGTISRVDGVVLVGVFLAYIYYSFTRRQRSANIPDTASKNVALDVAIVLVGLAGVVVSAYVVLAVIEDLVGALRLSGSMIGVITIGLASALPELSTVVESLRRKAPDIALGTLVGSNIVNPLLGIGLGGAISTYRVPESVVLWDLPFKIAVGVGLLAYVMFSNMRLKRRDGFYLVMLYFVFVVVRLVVFP